MSTRPVTGQIRRFCPPVGRPGDRDRLTAMGDASFTYTDAGELRTRTDATGTTAYT